jgi:chaperonin GroES
MKYEPMNERILVKQTEVDDRKDSKLILPNDNRLHKYFRVLAVGPGMVTQTGERVKPTLSEGDLVLMLSKSGTSIRINDEEFKLTSEREILCKVTE